MWHIRWSTHPGCSEPGKSVGLLRITMGLETAVYWLSIQSLRCVTLLCGKHNKAIKRYIVQLKD